MVRHYIFGPVASRRLGLSLGLDLVPSKTCSLDCVYCEAGKTTNATMERREYVPIDQVIAELDDYLREQPELDYITFSGAGEPTLNSKIGVLVRHIKTHYPQYKLCLLTNALGFGDPQLLRDIDGIDLAIPSLDGSNAAEFAQINRPVAGFDFDRFVRNLVHFTQTASCQVILELFIVPNINDSDESIARFVQIIKQLKLDRVQLNTLDRPGTEKWVQVPNRNTILRFIAAIAPICAVEAVGRFRYKSAHLRQQLDLTELDRQVMNFVLRRPATAADLALACQVAEPVLTQRLEELVHAGLLSSEKGERGVFYATNAEFQA